MYLPSSKFSNILPEEYAMEYSNYKMTIIFANVAKVLTDAF